MPNIKDYSVYISNTYNWIPWVTVIDSWKPWKNVWLLAITHWNETVWLQIFDYLIRDFHLQNKLLNWKVFLIAMNIEAYEKYISQSNNLAYRFIDFDMNRIFGKKKLKNTLEYKRFELLKPIFDLLDCALDLHSTSLDDQLIWITDEKHLNMAKCFFDIQDVLVDDLAKMWACIGYLLDQGKTAFGLECGNHNSPKAYLNWFRSVINLLIANWSIYWTIHKHYKLDKILKIKYEIIPKSKEFKFTIQIQWFTKLSINQIYATDNSVNYTNNFSNNIYIGLVSKTPLPWVSAWFLLEKIN